MCEDKRDRHLCNDEQPHDNLLPEAECGIERGAPTDIAGANASHEKNPRGLSYICLEAGWKISDLDPTRESQATNSAKDVAVTGFPALAVVPMVARKRSWPTRRPGVEDVVK